MRCCRLVYILSHPNYGVLDLHHEPTIVGVHLNLDGTVAAALRHLSAELVHMWSRTACLNCANRSVAHDNHNLGKASTYTQYTKELAYAQAFRAHATQRSLAMKCVEDTSCVFEYMCKSVRSGLKVTADITSF